MVMITTLIKLILILDKLPKDLISQLKGKIKEISYQILSPPSIQQFWEFRTNPKIQQINNNKLTGSKDNMKCKYNPCKSKQFLSEIKLKVPETMSKMILDLQETKHSQPPRIRNKLLKSSLRDVVEQGKVTASV